MEVLFETTMRNIALKITALFFGILLWFLVISQKDFQLTMEVPLNFVKLPENMAIASKPPHVVSITIEGKTWDLIRLRNEINKGNTNVVAMVIDLQKSELGSVRFHLTEKNFVAPGFPNVSFVEPDNRLLFIDVDIDTRITRNVPIRSAISLNAAQGYLLADDIKIIPEEIQVSGARNALARIIDIPTDSLVYDTLKTNKLYRVPLNFDFFPAFVTPSDSSVQIEINVQKMGSKSFNNIPVSLVGFYDKKTYSLSPEHLSVEITGGMQVLESISEKNIELFVEFNRFAIEDADSLPPVSKITLPPSVNRDMSIKAIQIKPEKVFLKKSIEKKDEEKDVSQETPQENNKEKPKDKTKEKAKDKPKEKSKEKPKDKAEEAKK